MTAEWIITVAGTTPEQAYDITSHDEWRCVVGGVELTVPYRATGLVGALRRSGRVVTMRKAPAASVAEALAVLADVGAARREVRRAEIALADIQARIDDEALMRTARAAGASDGAIADAVGLSTTRIWQILGPKAAGLSAVKP